jgi:hypothetical protein
MTLTKTLGSTQHNDTHHATQDNDTENCCAVVFLLRSVNAECRSAECHSAECPTAFRFKFSLRFNLKRNFNEMSNQIR